MPSAIILPSQSLVAPTEILYGSHNELWWPECRPSHDAGTAKFVLIECFILENAWASNMLTFEFSVMQFSYMY